VGAPPAGYLIRNRGRHHAQAAPTPPHVGSPHEALPYPGEPGRNEPGSRQASAHCSHIYRLAVYESRSSQVGRVGKQVEALGGWVQITGGRPARAIRQAVRREMGRREPGSMRQPSAKPANQGRRLSRWPRSLATVSIIQSAR
jgi:hypothetical protein